jgi:hypothetical protein
MSLENWLRSDFLIKHDPTVAEVQQLLAVVDRELSDAAVPGLSPDGKFLHAYTAALQLCVVALHANGYDLAKGKGHHHYAINSLEHTLGKEQADTTIYLSQCAKQRSQGMYERTGVVGPEDAEDLLQAARRLRDDVLGWLRANHPKLLPKDR